MSDVLPSTADWQLASPLIAAFEAGQIDRGGYWHNVQPQLLAAHPLWSGHDATRVARIMAPFPLQDGRYAPR